MSSDTAAQHISRLISAFTTGLYPGLVLNHLPLYSVFCQCLSGLSTFAPLPFGVLENGSNKDCVSVLSLSSSAYFPHLPPALVMQQINRPALPGLAWEKKKKKKKRPNSNTQLNQTCLTKTWERGS